MRDDLGLDFRTLREMVVLKAAVLDVLTTAEYVSQIAHRLELHPGSVDRMFERAFGCTPRTMRRSWKRAHRCESSDTSG